VAGQPLYPARNQDQKRNPQAIAHFADWVRSAICCPVVPGAAA